MIRYDRRSVEGFEVLISPVARAHTTELDRAMALLRDGLARLRASIPTTRVERLEGVRIWVEWDRRDNATSEFHRDRSWLNDHGYLPEKEKGIEISNLRNFIHDVTTDQPALMVHEFAHALQNLVLGDGDAEIRAAWAAAVESHRYDRVAYAGTRRRRAYALRDPSEYFA